MSSTETTPASPQGSAESHELPIGQILSIFWRGRWIILVCTVVATVLGYWYVQRRGDIWRAQSRVYVENSAAGSFGGADLLLGLGSKNYANTQAELMLSTEVLDGALTRFGTAFPEGTAQLFPDTATSRLVWLKKNVDVSVGKDDDIITVSLDSNHLEESCSLINGIVDAYSAFQEGKKKTNAAELRKSLQTQADKLEEEWIAAFDELDEFTASNPALGIDIAKNKLNKLTTDLATAELTMRNAQGILEQAKAYESSPEILREMMPALALRGGQSMAYPPTIRAFTEQIFGLRREKADLLVELTPNHPRIEVIDEAIAELETALDNANERFASLFLANLRIDAEGAKRNVGELARQVDQTEAELHDISTRQSELARHQSKVEIARTRLDTVYANLQQIAPDDDETELAYVNVLDIAQAASTNEVSGKSMRLAAAILLGLFLGAGLAWLRGLMDQKLRNAEEVRRAVDLAVLSIMPRVKLQKPFKPALDAWKDHSPSAEAARSLRTAVYFGMDKKETGNVLQVTSPDPGDGKTTTTNQLAIAMAKAGQSVLLIDADLRKPQQHARMGLDNDYGLCDVLRGDMPWKDAFHETDEETLHVLTSGPVPPNPAELLNDALFGKVLKQVSRRYDWVIVDSPPILPVADARIIASQVDLTLLTLRVDKSTRKRAKHAYDVVVEVGGEFLGAVLNDMPHGIGYGYGPGYGYYGRRYGYGGYGSYGEAPDGPHAEGGRAERHSKRATTRPRRVSSDSGNEAHSTAAAIEIEQPEPSSGAREFGDEAVVAPSRPAEEIVPKRKPRTRSAKAEAALAKIRANRSEGRDS